LEATLSRVAFFLCICTYRKSGVGSRELVVGSQQPFLRKWCLKINLLRQTNKYIAPTGL